MDRGVPAVGGSVLFGAARQLQRDQLGTYERAMLAHDGIVAFRVGPPRVGFEFDAVFSEKGARQILATDASRYRKSAPIFTELARVFGDGLATSDGERWRSRRRTLQPLFTPRRVGAHVAPIADEAAVLVEVMRTAMRQRGSVDLHAAGVRYALRVLGRTVFGTDLDRTVAVLHTALPVLTHHVARRGLSPVRLPVWLPTPGNREAERRRREMFALVEGLIARRRDAHAADDLLGRLLSAQDPETGRGLDDAAIRDEAITFLAAGHETTASALAFTLHLLARHETVQERLRTEVSEVVGDRTPTSEDLPRLRRTTQVVFESLRLYPPIHTLVRRSLGAGELLGHPLPAGRIVAVSIWGIHRNPRLWPEPQRFMPERFAEADGSHQDRYAHLPFGGGPRACVGIHLALAELVVAVAVVVRALRLRSPLAVPRLDAGVTLRPLGVLPCTVEPVRPGDTGA